MATTLTEYAKLSNDVMKAGVIETIIKDNPLLQLLPWVEINGNALTYNRELTNPLAEWHGANDDWSTSPNLTFTQKTASLYILGQNADVDNYAKQTRSNINDLQSITIEMTTKAIRNELELTLLYGNNTLIPNQFDGLIKLIDTGTASDQLIAAGASGGATLTLTMVDQLIDAVIGGKPDLLLMCAKTRRKLTDLSRAAGNNLQWTNVLGAQVESYNGIPIQTSNLIKVAHTVSGSVETAMTGGASNTIYAIRFGEDALCGLTGGGGMQVINIGDLETKDATRTRIKMYCGLVLFSQLSCAALIGIA
jgi:HK97 family phage major capsid protein